MGDKFNAFPIAASHKLVRFCGTAASTALGLGPWVFDVCLGVLCNSGVYTKT